MLCTYSANIFNIMHIYYILCYVHLILIYLMLFTYYANTFNVIYIKLQNIYLMSNLKWVLHFPRGLDLLSALF